MFKMDILTFLYLLQRCFALNKVPTAKGIIPESLSSIGQFLPAKINEKDLTDSYGRMDGLTLTVEKLRCHCLIIA